MRILLYLAIFLLAYGRGTPDVVGRQLTTSSGESKIETIVFLRHGEKPPHGLGQLTCQGLNRALALPEVLLSKFGKPDYIFAPNPAQKVTEGGLNEYDYIRPLATIEPTAIRLSMPVNTNFGFKEIHALQEELTREKYENALIFVAWEHYELEKMLKNLVQEFAGDPAQVPHWPETDYDSIYVLRINNDITPRAATLTHVHEGLDNPSRDCPEAKPQ
jgi:hypothetical protein